MPTETAKKNSAGASETATNHNADRRQPRGSTSTAKGKGPPKSKSSVSAAAAASGSKPKSTGKGDITTILSETQGAAGSPSSSPVRVRKVQKTTKAGGILKNPTNSASNKRSSKGDNIEVTPTSAARAQRAISGPVVHEHKQIFISFGIQLEATDAKSAQEDFHAKFVDFFTAIQRLDRSVAIVPLDPNDREHKMITKRSQFPSDMTDLSYAFVKAASYQFKPKWDKATQETTPPVVYGVFAIACDKEPEALLDSASFKWTAQGGFKLEIKTLQCSQSGIAADIYSMNPNVDGGILEAELQNILEEAHHQLVLDGELPDKYAGHRIPPTSLSKNVPKIPGQKKKKDENLSFKQIQARKVLQIEVDVKELGLAALLVEKATQMGLWSKYWGKWVKVSAPLTKKDSLVAKERQVQHHLLHQRLAKGTVPKGLAGIQCIDVPVSIFDSQGKIVKSFTFRDILLHLFKTPDGTSLLASVHQGKGTSVLEVVVPDGESFHRLLDMMGKNPAAYTFHYLTSMHKMDETFVRKLLDKTMDPSLVADVDDCEWDEKTLTLTTPKDKQDEKQVETLASQPWMMDLELMQSERVQKTSKAAFRLDDQQSLGTMHPKNDEKRKTAVQFGDDFDADEAAAATETIDLYKEEDDDEDLFSDAVDDTGYQPNHDDDTSPNSTSHSQDMFPDGMGGVMTAAEMAAATV